MNVCVHECVDVILCWVWPIYICRPETDAACVSQLLFTSLIPELSGSVQLVSMVLDLLLPEALGLHPPSIHIHETRDWTPDNMLVQLVLRLLSYLVSH